VNQIASNVAVTHPGKTIATQAYASYAYPPETFQMASNVRVTDCIGMRTPYDPNEWALETNILVRWATNYPGKPMYLWVYYNWPKEPAYLGWFHCFPGSFAHTIGKDLTWFSTLGISGFVYFNGWGEEVDAYVTYKLMDDPTLNVDACSTTISAGCTVRRVAS